MPVHTAGRRARRQSHAVAVAVAASVMVLAACHHSTSAPESPAVTLMPGAYLLTGVDGQIPPAYVPSCLGCTDSLRILPDTFALGETAGFEWHVSYQGSSLLHTNRDLYQGNIYGNATGQLVVVADGFSSQGGSNLPLGYMIVVAPDSFEMETRPAILRSLHVLGFRRRE